MEYFLPDKTISLICEVNKTHLLTIFYRLSVLARKGGGITHGGTQDPAQQKTRSVLSWGWAGHCPSSLCNCLSKINPRVTKANSWTQPRVTTVGMRMEQKYLCWGLQILKESHLTCYFDSSQKKRATQPTQQVLSKLRLFSCSWFWEKRNSLFSLLCIDRAAPRVVLQWSSGHISFTSQCFLGCFFLNVVSKISTRE